MSGARRVRIDLAYDGGDFSGWQVQPGRRTVQGVLEQTLSRLQGGRAVRVRGAGRTDAGVHARGQVADTDLGVPHSDADLLHALRSMLPPDLRPLRLATVSPTFHARHDAASKTYSYTLDRTPSGDPFRARHALHHPHPVAGEPLRRAIELLPGRRDWSGFAASSCEIEDRVRELSQAVYEEPADGVGVFTFRADGFLTHMVRILVGTLLEVARGRFAPERIRRILDSGDRTLAGPTAPPHGLCLEHIDYPDGRA